MSVTALKEAVRPEESAHLPLPERDGRGTLRLLLEPRTSLFKAARR